jgi:TPR repeat protein
MNLMNKIRVLILSLSLLVLVAPSEASKQPEDDLPKNGGQPTMVLSYADAFLLENGVAIPKDADPVYVNEQMIAVLNGGIETHRQIAYAGDIEAMNQVALLLEKRAKLSDSEADRDEAQAWYEKSAGLGSAEGMTNLASCIESRSTDANKQESASRALSLYLRAAEIGLPHAMIAYIRRVDERIGYAGNPVELTKALELNRRLVQITKNPTHMFALAQKLRRAQGCSADDNNLAEAFSLYKQVALTGMSTAYAYMGYMYEHGLGVPKDYKNANACYLAGAKSIASPCTRCIQALATNLYLGRGVNKSTLHDSQALRWLMIAAEKGEHACQGLAGIFLYRGIGCAVSAENKAQGLARLTLASSNQDRQAMLHMAYCLQRGIGCESSSHNLALGTESYSLLSRFNYKPAYFAMAHCLQFSIGTTFSLDNAERAYKLYDEATSINDLNAMQALVFCNLFGVGCLIDTLKARAWFETAKLMSTGQAYNFDIMHMCMGWLYASSFAIRDVDLALKHFEAIENKDLVAYFMGFLYLKKCAYVKAKACFQTVLSYDVEVNPKLLEYIEARLNASGRPQAKANNRKPKKGSSNADNMDPQFQLEARAVLARYLWLKNEVDLSSQSSCLALYIQQTSQKLERDFLAFVEKTRQAKNPADKYLELAPFNEQLAAVEKALDYIKLYERHCAMKALIEKLLQDKWDMYFHPIEMWTNE